MPRKVSMNAKLKKEITEKLMKMSIQVDGHVYSNKMISLDIATNNLSEINELRALGCHDERTLQVIEKLTRHMKNIIAEAMPQTSKNTREINIASNTLFSNSIERPRSLSNFSSSLDRNVTSPSILMNDIQTIDLTESPINENKRKFTPPKKLNATTIHKNFESMLRSKPREICTANTGNFLRTEVVFSQDIFEESQSILQDAAGNSSQNNNVTFAVPPNKVTGDKQEHTRSNAQGKDLKEKRQSQKVRFRIDKIEKPEKKTRKKQNKYQPYKRKYNKNLKSKLSESFTKKSQIANYEHNIGSISTAMQPCNKKFSAEQPNHNSTIQNTSNTAFPPGIQETCTVDITPQNKVIETDLSWVENIKYVRQILPENYDPNISNLIHDFWANCTISGLEENDFYIY